MDGTPTLRLNEFVLASLARNKIDLGPSTPSIPSTEIKVEELVFKVNKDIKTSVKEAEARFDKLVDDHEMAVRLCLRFASLAISANPLFTGPPQRLLRQIPDQVPQSLP